MVNQKLMKPLLKRTYRICILDAWAPSSIVFVLLSLQKWPPLAHPSTSQPPLPLEPRGGIDTIVNTKISL